MDEYDNGTSYFSELRGTTSYEDQTDNPVVDDTIEVFNTTRTIMWYSITLLIMALSLSLIIFNTKKFKKIGTIVLILTMLSTLAVPIYFGMALPSAMKEDYNDRVSLNAENDVELQLLGNVTPWYTESFSGDQEKDGVKVNWQPLVGWYISVGAFVFSCISVAFSILPKKDQDAGINGQTIQKPKSNRSKRFKKIIVVITIMTLVLGGITCYLIYLPWKYSVTSNTGYDELDEIGVTTIPEEANESELIKINVRVLSQRCRLSYMTFFTDAKGGGSNLDRVKIGLFTITIGPFVNGTEVWGIVRGYGTQNQDFILKEFTIQIGNVIRDDRSSLRIENVIQDPEYLTSTDKILSVSADVNSNANIERVELNYYFYGSDKYSGGSKLIMETDYKYFAEITFSKRELTDSDILYYKIGAKDLSGNTVVTSTIKVDMGVSN